MKAMVLKKVSPIEEAPLSLSEVSLPKPNPKEVLLKVTMCGICHTDLHTIEGELKLPKLPLIPGHQVVGKVEEIGKDVTRFKKGDR